MGWVYLIAAGLIEVVMALSLKQSDGWTRPGSSALAIVAAAASIFALTKALSHLPLGPAYAIWTGIGSVGVVVVGVLWLGEPVSAVRLLCITLIVAGTVGLRAIES